jgi:hypothetical protein
MTLFLIEVLNSQTRIRFFKYKKKKNFSLKSVHPDHLHNNETAEYSFLVCDAV